MEHLALGNWHLETDPVHLELKEDVKLKISILYQVLKVHEEIFKKEV